MRGYLDKLLIGYFLGLDILCPEFIGKNYHHAQAIYLRYLARRALRQGEPAIIGLHYLKRALIADWRIIFTSPWRTLATLSALIIYRIVSLAMLAQNSDSN